MDGFSVYLIAKLTTIVNIFTGFTIIGALIMLALFIAYFIWEGEKDEKNRDEDNEGVEYAEKMKAFTLRCTKIAFPIVLFLLLCATMIPNTKQAAAIYIVPKITQNENIEGISDKGLELIEKKLEIELEDLREENNNGPKDDK